MNDSNYHLKLLTAPLIRQLTDEAETCRRRENRERRRWELSLEHVSLIRNDLLLPGCVFHKMEM